MTLLPSRMSALISILALVAVLEVVAGEGASAQCPPTAAAADSSRATLLTRREREAAVAAVLATAALAPLDRPVQRALQVEDLQANGGLRRVTSGFAFAGGPGPFLVGATLFVGGRVSGSARVADRGVHLTEGVLAAAALNGLIKGVAGRALPNVNTDEPGEFSFGRGFHKGNGSFVSFPSGHTAASFAAAAVITDELSRGDPSAARIVGPIAYGTATAIALSRLYQNVHWVSDLPLGAAIGVWSGKSVVAWEHRHPGNWLDRHLLGLSAIPSSHGVVLSASVH